MEDKKEVNFKVGDMVELLKIYSPDMIIIDSGNCEVDGNYLCGWFDDVDVWHTELFRWDFLKTKEPA